MISSEIFLNVLLALFVVEVLKAMFAQILMDRRHNQMMQMMESDGFKAIIEKAEVKEVKREDN